ncbi:replication endonuclease [Acidithiobacillus acidisediminis]|uniref:replication endonuclease n=1 Tax=Acidithiobacillus acidisediminis TaxID=2937799 RepID=UPI00200D0D77|nr:replication endonuclease [Acidithiobacillus sp. S30A2]
MTTAPEHLRAQPWPDELFLAPDDGPTWLDPDPHLFTDELPQGIEEATHPDDREWVAEQICKVLTEWRGLAQQQYTTPPENVEGATPKSSLRAKRNLSLLGWVERSTEARNSPLYRTHHREALLRRYWHTDHARIALATKRYPKWVARHADMSEDTIRQEVKAIPTIIRDEQGRERLNPAWADRLGSFAPAVEPTPRKLRMAIRRAFRQFNESAAHGLRLVGAKKQICVSDHTYKSRVAQKKRQKLWAEHTTVTPHGGKARKLSEIMRSNQQRFAERYTLTKGLEEWAQNNGFAPLFITITCPPQFHINPSVGRDSWAGHTPKDGQRWLSHVWGKIRASLKKAGIEVHFLRAAEPHKDGTPHWHILAFAEESKHEKIMEIVRKHVPTADSKNDFTGDGAANASSYIADYLTDDPVEDDGEHHGTTKKPKGRYEPWRSTWGIRAYQFGGVLHGSITLWQQLRRLDIQPEEPLARGLWRAARGGRAALFFGLLHGRKNRVQVIREGRRDFRGAAPDPDTGELPEPKTKAGRILGLRIRGIEYRTAPETPAELSTDYRTFFEELEGFHAVTVIPNGSRRDPDEAEPDGFWDDYWQIADPDPPPQPPKQASR